MDNEYDIKRSYLHFNGRLAAGAKTVRHYLYFDIGPQHISCWRRLLAQLRIRPLPLQGIPDDAVITGATLTIYEGNDNKMKEGQ